MLGKWIQQQSKRSRQANVNWVLIPDLIKMVCFKLRSQESIINFLTSCNMLKLLEAKDGDEKEGDISGSVGDYYNSLALTFQLSDSCSFTVKKFDFDQISQQKNAKIAILGEFTEKEKETLLQKLFEESKLLVSDDLHFLLFQTKTPAVYDNALKTFEDINLMFREIDRINNSVAIIEQPYIWFYLHHHFPKFDFIFVFDLKSKHQTVSYPLNINPDPNHLVNPLSELIEDHYIEANAAQLLRKVLSHQNQKHCAVINNVKNKIYFLKK